MTSKRRSREFWAKLVKQCDRRGATVSGVAHEHGVRPRTLSWWRWRLGREDGEGHQGRAQKRHRRQAKQIRVLPVEVADVQLPTPAADFPSDIEMLELQLSSGLVLRFREGTNPTYLAAVLQSLQAPC